MPDRIQLAGTEEPEQLGPFRLLRLLGTGAMGSVFLAEDRDERRRVALKVLHPHLLRRRGFFQRFQREAVAGQCVEHPNVVRTLDCSFHIHDDTPYCVLVMEYVKGRTLREMLREHGTLPEALVREIARQVAAGLTAIHAAGIVHRDLKPENVLITNDHRVRIMDLGVARHTEPTTELTQEGQFTGSLLYAAPEQLRGRKVGPAADLYALGVLLYELLSGTNPFRHDDPGVVVAAHLETVPDRLDHRTGEVSVFLSELVTTLLAKRPEDRFPDAAALAEVLAERERSSWWAARERRILRERERRPTVPVRRETKLYGRETELAMCREAWGRARSGFGNTLLLEGEAGIGKSRLVDAFVSELDGENAHVLYGSHPPSGGMGGIFDAIVTRFGRADLAASLKPYLTATPTLVPAFAAVVKREASPEGAPGLQGDALHAVCVHLMRSLAGEKPLLWIVEDLHFADADSRKLLLSLGRAVEGHPVLMLATTRPGVPDDELAHLCHLENYRRVALGRLSAREVVLLLQDAFRSEALAEKLGVRIALHSDGIPLFIFEMIRGLKEGQFISQLPDGSWVETKVIERIEVPQAVKDLIDARLRDLSREDRAILNVGAVQGFEFDPELVASVRRLTNVQVLEILGDVERRHGVVRAAGDRYRFDHHQIQEVLLAALATPLRKEYHSQLVRGMIARCGADAARADEVPGATAVFLATHALEGGEPKEGLVWLAGALEHLARINANESALHLADAALAIPGLLTGEERVEILLTRNAGLDLLGKRDQQEAGLLEAHGLVAAAGKALRARVEAALGVLGQRTGRYAEAVAHFRKSRDWWREADDPGGEAQATGNLATVDYYQRRMAEAQSGIERVLAFARASGDRKLEARTIGNLGAVCRMLGRYAEARAHQEQSLALAREARERGTEARALGNLSNVCLDQGLHAEAEAYNAQCLSLAREIGDRITESVATGSQALLCCAQGRYEEAKAHCVRWLTLAREIGHRGGEADARGILGNVCYYQGRSAEAWVHYREHQQLALELGDPAGEAGPEGNLGNLCQQHGRYAEAREHFERALALMRGIGNRRYEAVGLGNLGSLCEAQDRLAEAKTFYESSLSLSREIGDRSDEAMALLSLGRLALREGDRENGAQRLADALHLAADLGLPDVLVTASALHAGLAGGDVAAAQRLLQEHGMRSCIDSRMQARLLLWGATGGPEHLAEAKRLLDYLVEHAPEEYRESMLNNVRINREIMEAWEQHGVNDTD